MYGSFLRAGGVRMSDVIIHISVSADRCLGETGRYCDLSEVLPDERAAVCAYLITGAGAGW